MKRSNKDYNKQSHMRAENCKKTRWITFRKAEPIKNTHSDIDETRLHAPDQVVQFTAWGTDIATWKQTILSPATHKTVTVLYCFTIKCATTIFLTRLVLWYNNMYKALFLPLNKKSVNLYNSRNKHNECSQMTHH
jgi:hypothetical protein